MVKQKKLKKFWVDLSVPPTIPDGFKVVKDTIVNKTVELDTSKLCLFPTEKQQRGLMVSGRALGKAMKEKLVAGATLADFLLKNPKLIPREFVGNSLVFADTLFEDAKGHKCYRVLRRRAYKYWTAGYIWCEGVFQSNERVVGYTDDVVFGKE